MRHIFISNRLPFTLTQRNQSDFSFSPSAGGLASALTASAPTTRDHKESYIWIGWPGMDVPSQFRDTIARQALTEHHSLPVYLNEHLANRYYQGFCNETLWPLFHYFPHFTQLSPDSWDAYRHANKEFMLSVTSAVRPDDIIWIHDYHLMLLPQYLREEGITNPIGFFLHTPFPSYEIFKMLHLPWQKELITGLLGADLLGFHTSSYRNNFIQTCVGVLGIQARMGELSWNDRKVHTDVFPISIDYSYFDRQARIPAVVSQKQKLKKASTPAQIITSVDRLDYSKEIHNRLLGYQQFLKMYPEFRKRILLRLTLIPSRVNIAAYQNTRHMIFKLIDQINSRYGTPTWQPIHHQYTSLTQDELLAEYTAADAALITPARDGMNLVAKEFVASRYDRKGVLILSKFAGASHELTGAIFVNPYSPHTIAKGIHHALTMSPDEQRIRMKAMQEIIKENTVHKWAQSFITRLNSLRQQSTQTTEITPRKILHEYADATKRLILLDYDGTLVSLAPTPEQASPTPEVLTALYQLTQNPRNDVVIISGRDRQTLDSWLGWLPLQFAAEHGAWIKTNESGTWKKSYPLNDIWKDQVKGVLQYFTIGLPGSFVEEKDFSLAFHYRLAPQKLAEMRVNQLKYELKTFLTGSELHTLDGNKVLEIKHMGINKGSAAFQWLNENKYDFVLAIGDDTTDEDLFEVLPTHAFRFKVGTFQSMAEYRLSSPQAVIKLLEILSSSYIHSTTHDATRQQTIQA